MFAKIQHAVRHDEIAGRLRHKHLTAMAHGRDPRCAMDVDPDIPLICDHRFPGVQTHTNTDRAACKRRLSSTRSRNGIGGARERDEESISLRVHLHPAIASKGLTQNSAMLPERLHIGVAKLVQQPSRPLDVREQERDGAGRQGHDRMMRRLGGGV